MKGILGLTLGAALLQLLPQRFPSPPDYRMLRPEAIGLGGSMNANMAAILAGVVSIGFLSGWALGRWMSPRAPVVLVVLGSVVIALLLFIGSRQQYWDALGYAILAQMIVAPSILGAALGGVFATWQRRRSGRG